MRNEIKSPHVLISYGRLFRVFETSLSSSTVLLVLIMISYFEFINYISLFAGMWLLGAAIATLNDTLDLVSDQVSHPDRPIPAGEISIRQARFWALVFIFLSYAFLAMINVRAMIVTTVVLIIGLSYSLTTKRVLLLKNLTVSGSSLIVVYSIPWIFDLAFDPILINLGISISFLLFGYEIMKDIRDVDGDTEAKIATLANRFSPKFSTVWALAFFFLSCIIMALGFLILELYTEMWLSIITALGLIAPLSWLYVDPSPHRSDRARYIVVTILSLGLAMISYVILAREM